MKRGAMPDAASRTGECMPGFERRGSSATIFIVATILIDAIGFGIVIPVLPRLVMELGHLDLASATWMGG